MTGNTRTVETVLDGLHVTLDAETGSIIRLVYPGLGTMLESLPDMASIIDLAYPIKEFEPLRLASRYSRSTSIQKLQNQVIISWEKLGPSRDCFDIEGGVAATVRLKAAPDQRSIIMTCEVINRSANDIRQVIFPDLAGIQPFAGKDRTYFRTGGFASLPFLELGPNEDRESLQYMIDTAAYSQEYQSGGMFHPMFVRWMDLGGLHGGMSLFPKRWGWDPHVPVRLHLSEHDDSLRLLCRHDVTIKPGEIWESGEYVLTPHTHGWAKGIEPYREWVKQNYQRKWPVPRHVREGLGYRTVWMCQCQPHDPKDTIFRFSDLPKLAQECKEYGLDEMVVWAWTNGFVLPLPPPFTHLGTEQDMADAVRECRRLGVNVAPFISVVQATAEQAPKYGLKVTDNNGWTYHTELIPRWNPPYASALACVGIPVTNELWRKYVLSSCKRLVDMGICSISWDQYWTVNRDTNIHNLTSDIRAYALNRDPEATFSGEELWNLEMDSAYLDYTWDWGGYRDCRAFTSVFPAPRINSCISSSPLTVRKCFADNLYLNILPRKKGAANGSDYIANHAGLSKALKQCAKLRKQFLSYFVDGVLIGDCILSDQCPTAHVSAYVLPDRVLMILLNQGTQDKVSFNCDIGSWLKSGSGKYRVKAYDSDGKPTGDITVSEGQWNAKTRVLRPGEIALYEFMPH